MSSDAEQFTGLTNYEAAAPKPPPGWELGHVVNHNNGSAQYTGLSLDEAIDPNEAEILAEMRLDSTQWSIKPGSLQVRKWQQKAGLEWCWYYRITAVRRPVSSVDLEGLTKALRKRKRRKAVDGNLGGQIWATSDWQIGKAGTIEMVLDTVGSLPDRFEASWIQSGKPDTVAVVFGGDLVEGCAFNYGSSQTFSVELNDRDQRAVVREGAMRIIDRAAAVAGNVQVIAVGGNHGENRASKGALMTDNADNVDVAAIEDCRWACRDAEAYEHVGWHLPGNDLVVCADIAGLRVAVTHGHQFRGQSKAEQWWDKQAGNHRPAGSAELLLTGHYHSLKVEWLGPRTWVQMPTEDAGSPWYAEVAGVGARRSGSLTIDVNDPAHIGHLRVV